MQPYRRQMSYDSLKLIVPRLKYGQRLHLSSLSRLILGIHRRSDPLNFSVSFLKFHQTYSNPDCTTGVLFVESVEYSFKSIGPCHVEIRCLGRKRVSSEKDVARRYFEYFLRKSKLPVRQLELIHCQKQFHNFHGIPIPRLRVQGHPCHIHGITQNFPVWHRMELVELIDSRIEYLEDVNISSARHIKFSAKLVKYVNPTIDYQLMWRLCDALTVTEAMKELRIEMNYPESFAIASGILLNPWIPIGSYVTGVFEKDLDVDHLYNELLQTFANFSPKITRMYGRKCVVLDEGGDYILVAFRDYFNTDSSRDCISFTSVLLKKPKKKTVAKLKPLIETIIWILIITYLVLFVLSVSLIVWRAVKYIAKKDTL